MGIDIWNPGGSGSGTGGKGIEGFTFKSTNPDGTMVYTIHYTDGSTSEIDMPKGTPIDLSGIKDNEVVIKNSAGELVGSGVYVNGDTVDTEHHIEADSIAVHPNTITLGSIQMKENGGFIENIPGTSDKHYLMLDYENDREQGTSKPQYWERRPRNEGATVSQGYIIIQNSDDEVMSDVKTWHYGNPTTDSQIQGLYVKFEDDVNNFKMKIAIDGKDISYYPSKKAWDGRATGTYFKAGRREILLEPFFSFLTTYDVTFEFKADNQINLKSHGGEPWLAVDRNVIIRKDIALMEDVTHAINNPIINMPEIAQSLNEATGDDRLDYNSLKNTPSPETAEVIASKLNGITTDEDKLDYNSLKNKPIISGGSMSGQQIVTELESLTGSDKLPASAIKDIPVYDETNLKAKVDVNTSNIAVNDGAIRTLSGYYQRLKTQTDLGDNIFSYRGSTVPTLPTDKVYHGYYIHLYAMTGTETLRLPVGLNATNGTIYCVVNEDRTDSIMVRPEDTTTIDGSSGVNVPAGNVLFLVRKDDSTWTVGFHGLIPSDMNSMLNSIKSKLPAVQPPLTIEEISAQLKDRLHTFREIQTEFANQLHTFDAIEANMVNKGFSKGFSVGYGLLDSTVAPHTLDWVSAHIAPNAEVIIQTTNQGQKHLAIYMPIYLGALVSKVNLNQQEIETIENKITVNELDYTVLISENAIDTSTTNRLDIEFHNQGAVTGSGITIDDGTTNKAGVTEIDVKGMYLDKVFDDSSSVTLNSVTSWETMDGMGGSRTNRVLIEPPLLTYLDPNVQPDEEARAKLYIQHNYFELAKPPGFLAYLSESEEVVGRIKPNEAGVRVGALWFDNIVVGGNSPDILLDKPNKAIGIEDYTGDDPNVTGGVPTLIAYRIAMKGKAPNDGYVEILLKKTDEGTPTQNGDYLVDSNDNPIGVRRNYKAGDELGVLDVMAIYMAKEQVKFQCLIEHNMVDDNLYIEDRTEGASGLMVQALDGNYGTGDALLQFENDTMQNIEFTKHYNGEDIFNMAWALNHDMADVDINAGNGQTSVDGLHFYNNTNLKVGISNKTIHIHDNGTDMAYFSLGQIFSAEKTSMLRGEDLDIKITLQDKDQAFNVCMVKWTGLPDKYTNKIVADYQNLNPVYEANWVEDSKVFISEDAVSGEHDFQGVLTVPADAVNFAVIIVPVEMQLPTDVYIKGFEINVSEPFYGWVLEYPEMINEKHLVNSERHAELRCDLSGLAEVRYTLNNVPAGMPMPIGEIKSGKADIEIDHTINQVSGSSLPQFEGAIKFNKDGNATIQTDVYIHSEKANNVLASTKFWYSKVSSDGNTFTKIPLSEYDVDVRGETKAINHMPKFKINVKAGDRIALFATTDRADGCFIDTTNGSIPMLKTVIDFDEITEDEQDTIDLINKIDGELELPEGYKLVGAISPDGVPSVTLVKI